MRYLIFFLMPLFVQEGKVYVKDTDASGALLSEGWKENGVKTGYWYFYHKNGKIASKGHYSNDVYDKYWYFYNPEGKLMEEGHFENGQKTKWWVFYHANGTIAYKVQYKNNLKEGYCFQYENKKITRIEKYKADSKTEEWTDIHSFEKENSWSDLR